MWMMILLTSTIVTSLEHWWLARMNFLLGRCKDLFPGPFTVQTSVMCVSASCGRPSSLENRSPTGWLADGFKHFLFSPLVGEMIQFWRVFFGWVETTNWMSFRGFHFRYLMGSTRYLQQKCLRLVLFLPWFSGKWRSAWNLTLLLEIHPFFTGPWWWKKGNLEWFLLEPSSSEIHLGFPPKFNIA